RAWTQSMQVLNNKVRLTHRRSNRGARNGCNTGKSAARLRSGAAFAWRAAPHPYSAGTRHPFPAVTAAHRDPARPSKPEGCHPGQKLSSDPAPEEAHLSFKRIGRAHV